MSARGVGLLQAGSGSRARWAFTDRRGGVSEGAFSSLNLADHVGDDPEAVTRNRSIVASWFSMGLDQVAVMRAAHGSDAALVAGGGVVDGVDILVSTTPDVALLALAADCVPIALADPVAGVVAAVHSGWRGVAAGAAPAAIAAMTDVGAVPGRITASLGAAICPGCYEVSQDVRSQVAAAAPAAAASTTTGSPAVDLHAGIRQQLEREGVDDVRVDPTCTSESEYLYSYRRDGTTGRQGVLVRLEEVADDHAP